MFGHFAAKIECSFPYQVKKLNLQLMDRAREHKQVFIADVAGLSNAVGYANAHDPRLYATAKVAFALDFLPTVAKAVTDIVNASRGSLKKCLILDLDNTIWGGVIGDDGMENIQIGELGMGHAFDALQRWAKELKHRGVILAVCSKNDDDIAKAALSGTSRHDPAPRGHRGLHCELGQQGRQHPSSAERAQYRFGFDGLCG